jgi:hypothetical protein
MNGRMEGWNTGMLEEWNIEVGTFAIPRSTIPSLHHSTTPSFHASIPRTLLARATWLALPATRAVARNKQQTKGK